MTPVRAGAVDSSVKRDGANGYYIIPLVASSPSTRIALKKSAAMGGTQFDDTATVLIDKNTPYRLLTEVFYSAGQAEFTNYRLTVINAPSNLTSAKLARQSRTASNRALAPARGNCMTLRTASAEETRPTWCPRS